MAHILRIKSKAILTEKIFAESKSNLPGTIDFVSRFLSIGKRVSWFSKGLSQVTAKMTDLESISELVFGIRMIKKRVINMT